MALKIQIFWPFWAAKAQNLTKYQQNGHFSSPNGISQNFQRFGIKKLISTSYALNSKIHKAGYQMSLLEKNDSKRSTPAQVMDDCILGLAKGVKWFYPLLSPGG